MYKKHDEAVSVSVIRIYVRSGVDQSSSFKSVASF